MKITCSQMDVLLSFYIDGDLSKALREKVEEHLKDCPTCRSKYSIMKNLIEELRPITNIGEEIETQKFDTQYKIFQNNLSAYIDNELPTNESIKMKKYTINNKKARKDLEETYLIRKLMNNSFNKTKFDIKKDYTKKILKQVSPKEENNININTVLKFIIGFITSTFIISSIIIYTLTF